MTKEKFVKFMTEFKTLHLRSSEWYDDIENVFGMSIVEEIISHSYESFIRNIIKENSTINEFDNIDFLIYECDWDFDKFCRLTTVNGEHPVIKSFEDFYDYIKGHGNYASI